MALGADDGSEQSVTESFLTSAKLDSDVGASDTMAGSPTGLSSESEAARLDAVPSSSGKAPTAAASSSSFRPDLSSVITQVTTRDAPAFPPPPPFRPETTRPPSWRVKMRSLFCCLAPSPHAYFKQHEASVRGAASNADGGGASGPRPIPVPPAGRPLELVLGAKRVEDAAKKTLVLDLDETLVHSSFKPIANPDYIIPVEIDGKLVDVYVLKRPWMDHFMEEVGERYEVVVFTASLSKYADPLLDLLDKTNTIRWRLFRESCYPYEGNYVKDLNCLGRDLASTIIVDNSPHSYAFQPANALPVGTFIDNMNDQELLDMLPVLASIEHLDDVRPHLVQYAQTLMMH